MSTIKAFWGEFISMLVGDEPAPINEVENTATHIIFIN